MPFLYPTSLRRGHPRRHDSQYWSVITLSSFHTSGLKLPHIHAILPIHHSPKVLASEIHLPSMQPTAHARDQLGILAHSSTASARIPRVLADGS